LKEIAMKEQINILIELQRIESESAGLQSSLTAVPETIAALEADLRLAEAGVSEKEAVFNDQKKKYRDQEGEVQSVGERIRASKEKLGSVKNNKEYQAILKEIDELEAKRSTLEDDMLEFLEHMDQTEADISEQRAHQQQRAKEIEAEKKVVREEADVKRSQLDALNKERDRTITRLEPALLAQFQKVRAAHPDGVAVAYVENAVCSGCHLNIPPQLFNELQKFEAIRLCPTCERIIYWREA
jgi:predicted  nucleic acid-binding Zn-ribbon protein